MQSGIHAKKKIRGKNPTEESWAWAGASHRSTVQPFNDKAGVKGYNSQIQRLSASHALGFQSFQKFTPRTEIRGFRRFALLQITQRKDPKAELRQGRATHHAAL
jgi:hypothetical protein